jgi:uncharacterized OB-fold protein
MDYNKPLPKINPDNSPFWNGCREHQLRFQKCKDCGFIRWPAAIICPECYSHDSEWIVVSGKGKIYSFVVYHIAYHSGFKDDLPYVVAIVKLKEGPHIYTNITKCNPAEVKCDMPVEVVWDDVTKEVSLPKFQPAT